MQPHLSILVCTHNPKRDYLDKVLAALKAQTFALDQWELLLIDNASQELLATEVDLTWHPRARHIREDQLGLTSARMRGIREAQSDILVFVDDDNILDLDYLNVAYKISQEYLFLGAWGGQIRGEFEVPPPEWMKPYLPKLAIREFEHDQWSNLLHQHQTTPCGAGLCIRKFIAEKYAELARCDLRRLNLDRKGQILFSGGDTDLAFTACDLGFGTGQFVALKITHLIPANRLEEDYLLRLMEGIGYSEIILRSLRGSIIENSKESWTRKLYGYLRLLKMDSRTRRITESRRRGQELAIRTLSESRS